jgi:DHA3 family multidrug efflux protein-like MFS transporter
MEHQDDETTAAALPWIVTIAFPIRSEILRLAIGFFLYLLLVPVAEASEQTVIQKWCQFAEQDRVSGFAQSVETAASPVTALLIGPIAQFWVLPSMADGALADRLGSWFGTGPDRGMALIFIAAGVIGLLVTLLALRSRPYRELSHRYVAPPSDGSCEAELRTVRLATSGPDRPERHGGDVQPDPVHGVGHQVS